MANLLIYPDRLIPKFSMPPAQIAGLVAEKTGTPIYDFLFDKAQTPEQRETFSHEKFDTIFLCSGGWMFCQFRDEVARLISNARRVIYIQNDYTVGFPSQFTKVLRATPESKRPEIQAWSSIPDYGERLSSMAPYEFLPRCPTYINWNALTYRQLPFRPIEQTEENLFYYGSFRKDRIGSFRLYLDPKCWDPKNPIISCTMRGAKVWDEWCPFLTKILPLMSFEELQRFSHTIYLEDMKTSQGMYASPANRFYECLSAGVAIIFDPCSTKTFEIAGFDVSDFVKFPESLPLSHTQSDEIRHEQRSRWGDRDYRQESLRELDILIKSL